jgi:cyanophycin synthetase
MRLADDLRAKVALFSLDENNPHIKKFAKEGKITCVYEEGL